jgi:hypothetical protein
VPHIFYWTPGNVVNHLKVELYSHTRCEEPSLSVIARSPGRTTEGSESKDDEAISSLLRKRWDCHADLRRLAMTALGVRFLR